MSRTDRGLLSDVVTDMYEALESMAKLLTNRPDKDLSGLQEQLIKTLDASNEYRLLLKNYIDYACRFRHAVSEERSRPRLSIKEVESFVYLTGLFLRLAMPDEAA